MSHESSSLNCGMGMFCFSIFARILYVLQNHVVTRLLDMIWLQAPSLAKHIHLATENKKTMGTSCLVKVVYVVCIRVGSRSFCPIRNNFVSQTMHSLPKNGCAPNGLPSWLTNLTVTTGRLITNYSLKLWLGNANALKTWCGNPHMTEHKVEAITLVNTCFHQRWPRVNFVFIFLATAIVSTQQWKTYWHVTIRFLVVTMFFCPIAFPIQKTTCCITSKTLQS